MRLHKRKRKLLRISSRHRKRRTVRARPAIMKRKRLATAKTRRLGREVREVRRRMDRRGKLRRIGRPAGMMAVRLNRRADGASPRSTHQVGLRPPLRRRKALTTRRRTNRLRTKVETVDRDARHLYPIPGRRRRAHHEMHSQGAVRRRTCHGNPHPRRTLETRARRRKKNRQATLLGLADRHEAGSRQEILRATPKAKPQAIPQTSRRQRSRADPMLRPKRPRIRSRHETGVRTEARRLKRRTSRASR
jgi:hypothetical protein